MRFTTPLLCLTLLVLAAHLSADIYKWTDPAGKVHFGDQPPAAEETPTLEQVRLRPINSFQRVEVSDYTGPAAIQQRVVMYSTSWCGYCRKARDYFAANDIAYKEHDIEASAAARRAYDKLGGKGVPVILVGNKRMNGFSAPRFAALYEH